MQVRSAVAVRDSAPLPLGLCFHDDHAASSVPSPHPRGLHLWLGCGPGCGQLGGLPAHLAAAVWGRRAVCVRSCGRVGGAVVEDAQSILAVIVAVALQQARLEQPLPPPALCEQGGSWWAAQSQRDGGAVSPGAWRTLVSTRKRRFSPSSIHASRASRGAWHLLQ